MGEAGRVRDQPPSAVNVWSRVSASYDKGTPVARPVRKAKGLNSETAWLSKREFG